MVKRCDCDLKVAKGIMVLINFVLLIVGLAFAIGGGVALSAGGKYTNLIPKAGLDMAVAVGVMLIIFSLVGIVSAWKHWRMILFVYAVAVFILIIIEIAAGVVIGTFLGHLKTLSATKNAQAQAALAAADKAILYGVNKTFAECCVNYVNTTVCKTIISSLNKAAPAPACNNPQAFLVAVEAWARGHFKPLGTALIVLGVIELSALVASCHLATHKERNTEEGYSVAGTGGDVSYQGTPTTA